MNVEELQYLALLQKIIEQGSKREDRTGTGTFSLFGTQLKFSLEGGNIPLLTTKKMFTKGIVEELLFFLRGETDTKKLEAKGVNIWKGNTSREFLDRRGLNHLPEGDMGKGYGFQLRYAGKNNLDSQSYYVDQLAETINLIKNDPHSRRILINYWNVTQLHQMALPPCHLLYQFYVDNKNLSCQFYMRSVDSFLGLPFNLCSASILTHLLAKVTGLQAKELIFNGGDTHCYLNHLAPIKEQLSRTPYDFPTVKINKTLNSISDMESLSFEDFEIQNYQSHPSIKAEMAV